MTSTFDHVNDYVANIKNLWKNLFYASYVQQQNNIYFGILKDYGVLLLYQPSMEIQLDQKI